MPCESQQPDDELVPVRHDLRVGGVQFRYADMPFGEPRRAHRHMTVELAFRRQRRIDGCHQVIRDRFRGRHGKVDDAGTRADGRQHILRAGGAQQPYGVRAGLLDLLEQHVRGAFQHASTSSMMMIRHGAVLGICSEVRISWRTSSMPMVTLLVANVVTSG